MRNLLLSACMFVMLLVPSINNAHAANAAKHCYGPYTFWSTGYSLYGFTASGRYVHPGTVAVDPRVIPLGSTVWVSGTKSITGVTKYHAEDTGGAIQGDRIDVWVPYVYLAYKITGYRKVRWCR